jgi:hypothetical protein
MSPDIVVSSLQIVLLSVSVVTVVVACFAVLQFSLVIRSMVPPRVRSYRPPVGSEEEEEPL